MNLIKRRSIKRTNPSTIKKVNSSFQLRKRKKEIEYSDGAEGMIKWCDDLVYVPIYPPGSDIAVWTRMGNLPDTPNPKTGKSYRYIWNSQKEVLREALRMGEDKRFIYRLIVFCWMRGEGKSMLACLIQLWKFFVWNRQQIMLGANSRDQVKFVHFDIMRDIIRNSPELYNIVGKRNIQEKEVRIKNDEGHVISIIRSISSFSGIVSNITGYTFSEIFDMKNPKFFVQLDGSIRNIPNAIGVIDSTVSDKTHVLYRLYRGAAEGKMKTVFFSYRHSKHGDLADYWNPNMDEEQLNDYQAKFPFGEFERYFLNLWSAGLQQVFSPEMVEEIGYAGSDGLLLNHADLAQILEKKEHLIGVMNDTKGKGFQDGVEETSAKITALINRCKPIESIYKLTNEYNNPRMATMEDLKNLTEIFDTNWSVMAAMDFGDPYAVRGLARTIMTIIAKGLPKSRTTPYLDIITGEAAPKYLYCVLHVAKIDDHSLDRVKEILEEANEEFDGIDTVCSERYGAWDVGKWCEEREITFEPVFPTYDRQRDAFKEVLMAVGEGRFKCPWVNIPGSKKEDITREEFEVFQHDASKRWFGSTEKFEKYGIQDDYMFATGWCMYGGRNLNVDNFRIRKTAMSFGMMFPNKELLGKYA